MPAVARALRTGGSNRSSPAPTTSNSSNNVQQEKEVEDVELESGEDGSPPAKKRKQKNPEKSHVEKMKQEASSLSSTEEQTTDELEQDDLVDQMVADEQQMLNEEVVETVVQNEEDEEETTKSTGDDNDIENQEKKSIQIRIASNGQSEEGEDPSQGKFVVLEKENGQNAQNETMSDDEDVVKNQEVDHETTVEMEQIVEDDETVELTPYTEKSHNGHSGHILTTIPAGQHIQGYEMIDGDNTQQGDMVMVLQQQLIQMPRSEAYRLGYIHPNSIGNGHPGAQFMMPTIVAGQPAVMPVAQLGNLGQVAIMSPSQVVVQITWIDIERKFTRLVEPIKANRTDEQLAIMKARKTCNMQYNSAVKIISSSIYERAERLDCKRFNSKRLILVRVNKCKQFQLSQRHNRSTGKPLFNSYPREQLL